VSSHPKCELKKENALKIVGLVLVIAGVVALIYGGFSYTTQKKAVDVGPIQIDKTEHHSVPLPPLLGVVAIIGGGALFYFGAKGR
jgi:drug/metabolite transporter (DMT)-like permease